jgi:hypothetical protein
VVLHYTSYTAEIILRGERMTHPGEAAPGDVAAELFRQTPAEARLAEAFSPNNEITDQYEPRFWETVNRTIALEVNTHDQQSLLLAADYLHWQCFGHPGDPLPAGLVLYTDQNRPLITIDGRQNQAWGCIESAVTRLEAAGLRNFYRDLDYAMQQHDELGDDAYYSTQLLIQDCTAFQLLESFDTQLPEQQPQPLTPRQKGIRISQIESGIADTFNLPKNSGRPQPGSPAELALRRELWQLDDERQLRTKPRAIEQNAYEQLRRYVIEDYVEHLSRKSRTPMSDKERRDTFLKIYKNPPETDGSVYLDASYVTGERLGLDKQNPLQYTINMALLGEVFIEVIDRKEWNYDYETFLAEMIRGALEEFFKLHRESVGYTESLKFGEHVIPRYALRNWLLQPQAAVHRYDSIDTGPTHHYHPHTPKVHLVSARKLRQQQRTIIGTIKKSDRQDTTTRLIQTGPRAELEAVSGDEDLILSFNNRFKPNYPLIAGYRLVGRTGQRYGFRKETTDPYTTADIPIPLEAMTGLRNQYQKMGLYRLVEALDDTRELTVEQFRSLLARELIYFTPTTESNDKTFSSWQLQNFTENDILRKETFQIQCSGAAHFLRLSLDQLFGPSSAGVIQGISFKASDKKANAARHAQTTFSYEGFTYILDATPSRSYSALLGRLARQLIFAPAPPAASVDSLRQPPPPDIFPTDEVTNAEQFRELRLAQFQDSFKGRLLEICKTVQLDEVYEHIRRLGESDPLRKTTETILRATISLETGEVAKSVHSYLENYNNAPATKRHHLRLRSYGSRTVGILSKNVRRLVDIVSDDAAANTSGN